jgi:hypothetical protein
VSDISRRDMLGFMATLPVAAAFGDRELLERAARAAREALAARAAGQQYSPKFFTPAEWRTVRILVDLIIPRDERSGSATEAGVPEFMDFTLSDRPGMQASMREGLAWLDAESRRRFSQPFADLAAAQQTAILDDIAWPARARPELQNGARFFTQFRDMTASGFWSSKVGVQDLQFMGNTVVPQWTGCSDAALRKLGVSYEEWDRKYAG